MPVELPLAQMTHDEKLQAMQLLWAELSKTPEQLTSPAWHRDVLRSRRGDPIPFRVTLNGEAPGDSHGVDVSPTGDGVLRDARLYQLVRVSGPVQERHIEIQFARPDAEAYAFTFG